MLSKAIVEDFDILKGMASNFLFRGKNMSSDRRSFVSTIKGFLCGIVIAVAFRAHALPDGKAAEQICVIITGVGAATIAVMDQSLGNFATTS